MKVKKDIVNSVVLSVLVHIFLFAGVAGIKVTGVYSEIIKKKTKQFFDVKIINKEVVIRKPVKRREVVYVESLKFEQPQYSKNMKSFIEKEEIEKRIEDAGKSDEQFDIVKKFKKKVLDDLAENEKNKVAFRKKTRRDTKDDIIPQKELALDDMLTDPRNFFNKEDIPKDFYEKMPGFTPQKSRGFANLLKSDFFSSFIKGYSPVITRAANIEDIHKELIWSFATYQDPQDGQKYFKISIGATRSNTSLLKIPKEIIFLVDCSISIEQKRLEEFKKGINYCLTHLNEEDRFNIMAFKETTLKFRNLSVSPTEKNIENALLFISKLTAGEKTDTYSALYESINIKDAMSPSYIILLSDGRPTKGVIDSRKVINKISRLNDGKISIFAFSGGLRVNRYLLDFISYKNRGWAQYSQRRHYIGRNMANMYEKIKDPLLINLRYYINGLNEKEMFPKMLPDFFKNVEFALYGKYKREKEFSLQLLGDAFDETSEFIISGKLNAALKGDRIIARNWAFNKIYHLIGQLSDDKDNTEIVNEIKLLSKKFGIKTPYSKNIRK